MIDFMVIALPRSGTAWAANLLTTDTSVCLHEAFMDFSIDELDSFKWPHKLGVAETSGAFCADEINKHPARKLVIDRPIEEINQSANKLGLPELTEHARSLLDKVNGYKIDYKSLFDYKEMSKAYKFLLEKDLDPMRHALLCDLHIENITAIEQVRRIL